MIFLIKTLLHNKPSLTFLWLKKELYVPNPISSYASNILNFIKYTNIQHTNLLTSIFSIKTNNTSLQTDENKYDSNTLIEYLIVLK